MTFTRFTNVILNTSFSLDTFGKNTEDTYVARVIYDSEKDVL